MPSGRTTLFLDRERVEHSRHESSEHILVDTVDAHLIGLVYISS